MFKFQKRAQDRKTLRNYKKRLEAELKVYSQRFEAISEGGRKNRALCLGECALQGIEKLQSLVNQQPQIPFIPGTLIWHLNEERVRDRDSTGELYYSYSVTYEVMSREKAYTRKEIRAKVREAAEKIHAETDEMFRDEMDEDEETEE